MNLFNISLQQAVMENTYLVFDRMMDGLLKSTGKWRIH